MPDDQADPVRDDQMPMDPVTGLHMHMVGLHQVYVQMRRAGWGILSAAAYLAASGAYNGEEQAGDQS